MAQAVSRRSLTANARVRSHISHMGFVVDKVALGDFYLRVLRFCPIRIVPSGCTLFIHLFFFMARQPYMGLGLLVSSRFHGHTL